MTAKTLAQHDELMKKTETMNILIESNKLLREEKEKMEEDLQQAQAKVSVDKYTLSGLHTTRESLSEPNVLTHFWMVSVTKDGIGHLATAAVQLGAEREERDAPG